MTHDPDALELNLPIPRWAIDAADRFAAQQPAARAVQIRRNTIAVCAVDTYLQLMGIATDRAASDSWNPVVQLSADVADLQVTHAGRLECRPLLPDAATCHVPPEVWGDRIGYVAVRVDEAQSEAALLGFVSAVDAEEIPLSQLQPIEALLDQLDRLLRPAALTVLSQWLQGRVEAGWQTVDALLNPPQLSPAFRSAAPQAAIRRGKAIALGDQQVALTIALRPAAAETEILLQVHPLTLPTLPPGLELRVLDQTGAVFLSAQARQADDYLQLQLSGSPAEQFAVQLAIAPVSVTEEFAI